MIRYPKLLFAKEWNRIWKTKLFNFFFFDHTFHTHMSTYFQTQDLYQNIHCKQTADNKSNNKIAALLTLELICFPSKLSSINSRLKSGLFTLQLMGSLWVVQGRWIWEDSLRWGSLTQQLWRRETIDDEELACGFSTKLLYGFY